MKWILFLIFIYPSFASALDPAAQNIVDGYLTPKKQPAPSNGLTLKARISKLREDIETLQMQSSSLTSRMQEAEANFEKKKSDFVQVSKYSSLYKNLQLRSQLVQQLSDECCKMVKDPAYREKNEKKIHERWQIETDKYTEEQRKKQQ